MTGQLKAKAPLDYETKTSYMVIVTVTDGKNAADSVNPAVDDRIRVTITVMDVNEAPEFAAETATRSVAENTVSNANIGIPVVAMDEDRPMQSLTYTLGAPMTLRLPLCQPLGSCKPWQHWTMKPRPTMR